MHLTFTQLAQKVLLQSKHYQAEREREMWNVRHMWTEGQIGRDKRTMTLAVSCLWSQFGSISNAADRTASNKPAGAQFNTSSTHWQRIPRRHKFHKSQWADRADLTDLKWFTPSWMCWPTRQTEVINKAFQISSAFMGQLSTQLVPAAFYFSFVWFLNIWIRCDSFNMDF